MAKKRNADTAKTVHAPGEPVYTVMAFITLVGLALGCTLLYLDFDEYGQKTAPSEKVPALTKLGETATAAPGVPSPPVTP